MGEAPGHRLEFPGGEGRRVEGHASLGPAKGQVEQGALPGHQRSQCPHFVEVGVGVIAQATLERTPGPVVLDPIATEREDGAVIGVDGHLHIDLSVRLGQQDPYVVFDVEQCCGPFDIGADRFVEGGRHGRRLAMVG